MTLDVTEIVTRPHRAHVGNLENLTRTLGSFSGVAVVYQPSVGYVLLGGERRFAAHVRRGDRRIEVYVLRNWSEWVAWMARDKGITAREQQEQLPMDAMDAGYLDTKAQLLLSPARSERPTHDIAEYLGMPEDHVSTARAFIRLLNDTTLTPDIQAQLIEVIREVRAGTLTPHGAWDRFSRYRKRASQPRRPAAEQSRTLANVAPQLAGFADALASIGEINPEMPLAEVEGHITTLVNGKTAIDRVLRALRAVKNQHSGEKQ